MKRKLTCQLSVWFLASAWYKAIFADVLGLITSRLEQGADWPFAFGTSLTLCAVLYYRFMDEVHSKARKLQDTLKALPNILFFQLLLLSSLYAWFGSSGRWVLEITYSIL